MSFSILLSCMIQLRTSVSKDNGLRHSGCKPGRSVSAQSPGYASLSKGMQISTLNVTGAAGRMTRLTSNSQGGSTPDFMSMCRPLAYRS